MNNQDREKLKVRLRALAEAPPGLRISAPEHWSIKGIQDPKRFFQHLPILMEPDSILYLEGTTIHPEAATFYLRHQSKNPLPVTCGTVFPIPDIYHVNFSSEVFIGILEMVRRRPIRELVTHLCGYRLGHLVFSFHDAFENSLEISEHVPEEVVAKFCGALEVAYSRERTAEPRQNAARELLSILEHPEKLKTRAVPWWRHILDEFLIGWRGR